MKIDIVLTGAVIVIGIGGYAYASTLMLLLAGYLSLAGFKHEYLRRKELQEYQGKLFPREGNQDIVPSSALRFSLALCLATAAASLARFDYPAYRFFIELLIVSSPLIFMTLALASKSFLNQTLESTQRQYQNRRSPAAADCCSLRITLRIETGVEASDPDISCTRTPGR